VHKVECSTYRSLWGIHLFTRASLSERFSEGFNRILRGPYIQIANTNTPVAGSYWHTACLEVNYRCCRVGTEGSLVRSAGPGTEKTRRSAPRVNSAHALSRRDDCTFSPDEILSISSTPSSLETSCYEHQPLGPGVCLGGAALAHSLLYLATASSFLPSLDLLS
jgi:hypothetical protein